jgi:methyltransferase (TIGR00027 family)
MTREKVTLTAEKETLLITLYARAEESRLPDSLLRDRFAAATVDRVDYDFARLRIGRDIAISVAMRAKLFDDWTRDFIAANPEAVVLHLGCGLDSRVFRLDPPASVLWFEVDYPEVIALRRRLYPERLGCRLIASSVTEPGWLSEVPRDRPAIIVAEGVFPYLPAEEVPALLERLTAHFPRGEIAFDGYSGLGLRLIRRNHSVQATGAALHWSIEDSRLLEQQVPRLKLVAELTNDDPAEIARMPWKARLTIRLFFLIPAFRRIGRMLRYRF